MQQPGDYADPGWLGDANFTPRVGVGPLGAEDGKVPQVEPKTRRIVVTPQVGPN